MRGSIQTSSIYFRANGRLVDALYERAQQSGVSVSEYMRGIVREKVGFQ